MASLAPLPDFRYVGFAPGERYDGRVVGGVVAAAAGIVTGIGHAFGAKAALAGGLVAAVTGAYSFGRARAFAASSHPVPMALVPWGLMVEHEAQPRILRWAAIRRVDVEVTYGREQDHATLWSHVTVETERERFRGKTPGAAPLERLIVHLDAYAREAGHAVALDLEGTRAGVGPEEPDVEPLLGAARAYVASGEASLSLGLEAAGYRNAGARRTSDRALEALGAVLGDRTERENDPRPFAAVVAAEIGAVPLGASIVALVQSPHPVVAAVAKAACRRLGVASARAGTLDEVAPFLLEADRSALEAWAARATG